MGSKKITSSTGSASASGSGLTANGEQRQYVRHSYTDLSMECDKPTTGKEEDMLHRYNENRVGGPFPLKLQIILKILEEEGTDMTCIMSWLPHGRAFVIHNSTRFEQEVVKRFFKHSQVSSFRRQLNLYGFLRLSNGRDTGGYYHESFLRGKPLLSLRMVRTKVKGTKIRASSSPADEPRFYGMTFLGPVSMNMNHRMNSMGMNSMNMRMNNMSSMGHNITPPSSSSSFNQTKQHQFPLQNILPRSDSISTSCNPVGVGGGFFPLPTNSRSFGQQAQCQHNPMMQQQRPQQASFNRISKQSPDIMNSSDFSDMKGMNMGMDMNMNNMNRYGSGSNNRTQDLLKRTLEQGRRDLMKANMIKAMNQKLEALNSSLASCSSPYPLSSSDMMDLPSIPAAPTNTNTNTCPRELAHRMAREHYFSQFENAMNQTSNLYPTSKHLQLQQLQKLHTQYGQGQRRAAVAPPVSMPSNMNMNSMMGMGMGDMMKSKMQIDAASAMVSLGSKMDRRESSSSNISSEASINSNSTEEEKDVASTMMALGATVQQAV